MANVIETTISINDNMTKAFKNVTTAVNQVISSMESMSRASGNAINTRSLEAARRSIANAQTAFEGVDDAIDDVRNNLNNAGNSAGLFEKKCKETNSTAQSLKSTLKSIAATAAAAFGGKQLIELSDTMSQTKARLDLMNDGQQTTAELQNKIAEAAKNSRGSYQAMADMVSKLGINAGEAFSSSAEIVDFAEQVNKQFTISGAGASEAANASLQLTQALASGTLRGDELNSIFEQAPTLIRTIADSLGVSVGEIRTMASEGQITADVVKNALLGAADETNKKFEQMPKTFGQVWTQIKNQALFAFQPMLEKLNEIANSDGFNKFVGGAMDALNGFAVAAENVVQALMNIASNDTVTSFFKSALDAASDFGVFLAELSQSDSLGSFFDTLVNSIGNVVNAFLGLAGCETAAQFLDKVRTAIEGLAEKATPVVQTIGDIIAKMIELAGTTGGKAAILGLATAFGVLKIGMAGVKISDFINKVKGLSEVGTFAGGLKSLAMSSQMATAAQWLFNTSLYGCPIIWIIAAIVALIAIIVLCVKHWDKIKEAAGKALDGIKAAWGAVVDWFKGLWDKVKEVFNTFIDWVKSNAKSIVLFIINPFAGIFSYLYDHCEGFRNFVDGVVASIKGFFAGLWNGIVSGAQWLWNGIVSVFSTIRDFIVNVWNGVVSVVSTVWNAIWGFISPIVTAIWNLITTVFNVIWQIISTVCMGIWNIIVTVWNTIKTTIVTVLTTIWNFIQTVWNTIKTVVLTVLNAIWNTIQTVWNAIWNTISTVLNAIWNFIQMVWNAILTYIVPVLQTIWNTIQTVWNAIKSTVVTVVGAIKEKITTIWNNIKSVTSTVWNGIKSTISSIIDGIVAAVDKVKEVYTKIKNKFNEVLDFLKGLKDKFKEKAKEMIEGLILGIADKINGVTAKIRELGEKAVGALKEFFKIGSPSKLMRAMGQFVGIGFDNGLNDMINRVKKTTLTIGDAVVSNVEPVVTAISGEMKTSKTPEDFKRMREFVTNRTTNNKTVNAPIYVTVNNDNTINNDMDLSRVTRFIANGIAQQVGLVVEGV